MMNFASIMNQKLVEKSMLKSIEKLEDICISGVSGRFPESKDIEEYATNLLNGCDELSSWITQKSGQKTWMSNPNMECGSMMNSEEETDIEFIGIDCQSLQTMDIKSKRVIECVYDSMFDSGINPVEMCGSETAVFIACATGSIQNSECQSVMPEMCLKNSVLARNVSEVLKLNGPVDVIEGVCSGFMCLDKAIKSMENGECEQAIVCGVDTLMSMTETLNLSGCNLSIGCVFLQKRQRCKRIYAKIIDSEVMSGVNEMSMPQIIQELYSECNIDPSLVTYIESYGNRKERNQEIKKIANIFAEKSMRRELPLHIGSVQTSNKSHLGVPQFTGIIAVMRMVVSIQRGILPASSPKPITAVLDGHTKMINSNMKHCGGLMALNASCENMIVHVLLQPNTLFKMNKLGSSCIWNQQNISKNIPTLLTMEARREECLEKIMEKMKDPVTDLGAQCLLENIATETTINTSNMEPTMRGFCVLNSDLKSEQIKMCDEKKPVCYVFSGISTEWNGEMCQEMMKLETFKQSIVYSAECLIPHEINLCEMIMSGSNMQLNQNKDLMSLFVCTTAIQIALVDCLAEAGVSPKYLIGHSIGELACAYADKALTAQETILAAYQHARCIEEAKLPEGAMASIGLTWENVQEKYSSGWNDAIELVSHNSPDNIIISGPKQKVQQLCNTLKQDGIFVKEIDTQNIALHSHFMTSIAPQMKKSLEKVIPAPGIRTSKWISTSIPSQRWNSDIARNASSGYLVNNLSSHILFREALQVLPQNALVIEIGPSHLLKNILMNNLPSSVVQCPLMVLNQSKVSLNMQLVHFWTQLGIMYINGVSIQPMNLLIDQNLQNLSTIYPVPVNTRFISDMARLTYLRSDNQNVCGMNMNMSNKSMNMNMKRSIGSSPMCGLTPEMMPNSIINTRTGLKRSSILRPSLNISSQNRKQVIINPSSMKSSYLLEHKINGKVVYPVSGIIFQVWSTLCEMKGLDSVEKLPVQLKNIQFYQMVCLENMKPVTLGIQINEVNGEFQVINSLNGSIVCTGNIQVLSFKPKMLPMGTRGGMMGMNQNRVMDQGKVYEILRENGHDLSGEFQSIIASSTDGTFGEIEWTSGHWISLLDCMMQMNVLVQCLRNNDIPQLSEMTIKSVVIDPDQMYLDSMQNMGKSSSTQNMENLNRTKMDWSKQEDDFLNMKRGYGKSKMNMKSMVPSNDESFEIVSVETGNMNQHPIKNIMEKLQSSHSNNSRMMNILPVKCNPLTGTITCGGICICEAVCGQNNQCINVAQNIQKHILNKNMENNMEFVSYIKNDLCGQLNSMMNINMEKNTEKSCLVDQGQKEMIQSYIHDIQMVVSLIIERIENTGSSDRVLNKIQSIISNMSTSCIWNQQTNISKMSVDKTSMLQIFIQAALLPQNNKNYINEVRHLFIDNLAMYRAINEDSIINSLPYKCNLKSNLDTVIENINCGEKRKLRVLEISASFNHCFANILNGVLTENKDYSNLEVDYKFCSVFGNPNEEEIIDYMNRQYSFKCDKVNWEILQNGELNHSVPKMLQNFDLVIMNSSLQILLPHCQDVSELKQWVETCVRQTMQPQGFLMIHELTREMPSTSEICKLEQILLRKECTQTQNNNHVHKIHSEKEWRELMEEIGDLIPVSIKSDLVWSSCMLYHNKCNIKSPNQISFIDIDRDNQEWASICIESMKMNDIKRVLLIGETLPSVSTLNQIESLRKNFGGQKIRCILAMDEQPIQINCLLARQMDKNVLKGDKLDFHDDQLIMLAVKADLFMNVFCQGKWGSIQSVLKGSMGDSMRNSMRSQMMMGNSMMRPSMMIGQSMSQLNLLQCVNSKQESSKLLNMKMRSPLLNMKRTSSSSMPLRTSSSSMSSNVRQLMPHESIKKMNNINMTGYGIIPVIMIHSLEGHVNMLSTLAKQIKSPVYGIQFTSESMHCKSILELAKLYLEQIQSEIGRIERVHLCGFGFGALVAMEMSELMSNKCASLTLLDCGKPCMSKYNLNRSNHMKKSMEKIETEALFTFAQKYLQSIHNYKLMDQLMSCTTLQSRVNLVVSEIMENSQLMFDQNDLKQAAISMIIKCTMLENYQPTKTVCTLNDIILIKPSEEVTELESILHQKEILNGMNIETHVIGCDQRSFFERENCMNVAGILNENIIRFA